MDPTPICSCWHNRIDQLDQLYRIGSEREFYQVWDSLMSTCVDKQAVDAKLSLLVDFKLRVHFAVRQLTSAAAKGATGGCSAIDRLSAFLQENGTKYSTFPQLSAYFALPYIRDNVDHPLLADIRQPDWIDGLSDELKLLLGCALRNSHNQQIDAARACNQRKRYSRLKERYMKLRDDHKNLLELATRLVATLESSVGGEEDCGLHMIKNYNEQVGKISEGFYDTGGTFQWEARPKAISGSSETIHSDHEDDEMKHPSSAKTYNAEPSDRFAEADLQLTELEEEDSNVDVEEARDDTNQEPAPTAPSPSPPSEM